MESAMKMYAKIFPRMKRAPAAVLFLALLVAVTVIASIEMPVATKETAVAIIAAAYFWIIFCRSRDALPFLSPFRTLWIACVPGAFLVFMILPSHTLYKGNGENYFADTVALAEQAERDGLDPLDVIEKRII